MSIINNSHAIGVDSRNLVLKTRGTLHVKVGDRYYEIDFRNLIENNKDEKQEAKEEYILTIDSKEGIDTIEYPGDNKLIVGFDGSLFVTKNNTFVDVTPKTTITTTQTPVDDSSNQYEVTSIESALVTNRLYGTEGYSFDFANGDLRTRTLVVEEEVDLPTNTIKNRCCKTYSELLDDGSEEIVRNYQDYDFIEIEKVPDYLTVKSGAMVKANVNATITINVSGLEYDDFEFVNGSLYIIYTQNDEVVITKLN